MPLYEFFCEKCRIKTEDLCSSSVESTPCRECGGKAKKVLSTFRTGKSASGGFTGSSGSSSCGGCTKTSCSGC